MVITHSQGCQELELTQWHVTTLSSMKHEGIWYIEWKAVLDEVVVGLYSEKSSMESWSCLHIFLPETFLKIFSILFLHMS